MFRCHTLVADPSTVFSPGELVVSHGRVVHLGATRRRPGASQHAAIPIADAVILPGLVNAHAHLALPRLGAKDRESKDEADPDRNDASTRPQFGRWIRSVQEARAADVPSDCATRVACAGVDFAREGCFAVGEIDSTGTALPAYAAGEILGRIYREVLGFHLVGEAARAAVRDCMSELSRLPASVRGLSPHAPYSVSPDLFRAAAASGESLQVHVAETEDEVEFLRDGQGPFRELLESLGRWEPTFQPPGCSPVAYLERLGVLGPKTAAVHAQHLQPGDLERLVDARSPVVLCPQTVEYFGRTPPPLAAWLRAGLVVALGTDSRASAQGPYAMAEELRVARRLWPDVSSRQLLAAATAAGGEAIARPELGRLRLGGPAHFFQLAVPDARPASLDAVLDAWLDGELPVVGSYRSGRSVG